MPVKKTLPTRHKASEKAIFKLVSKRGVSKTICKNQLKLPPNYFNIYIGTSENFNSAMAKFTSDVLMKSVISNLEMDSSNRKYLMQKLRVFDTEIELPIKKMTCAKHASQNLSFAMDAYCKKEIGDDSLMQIRSACETFSKLMVSTDIEMKIARLEKLFEEGLKNENH